MSPLHPLPHWIAARLRSAGLSDRDLLGVIEAARRGAGPTSAQLSGDDIELLVGAHDFAALREEIRGVPGVTREQARELSARFASELRELCRAKKT